MKPDCPGNRKLPVTADHVNAIMQNLDRENVDAIEVALRMSFGCLGFLRLAEIVRLTFEDVRVEPDGLLLNIRNSKTDQTGVDILASY